MYKTYLLPMIALTAVLIATPLSFAEKEILSPPATIEHSENGSESDDVTGEGSDLNRELLAPDDIDGAEVRSYDREDGTKITEYSVKGRVYMMRVKPANMPAYYLYDNNGDGSLEERLPGGYKPPSPPMWIIKRF